MKWNKLKDYKCPECISHLNKGTDGFNHVCSNLDCKFEISTSRFNEIISGMHKPKHKEPDRSGWE